MVFVAKMHFFEKKVTKCLVNSKKSSNFALDFMLSSFYREESVWFLHI